MVADEKAQINMICAKFHNMGDETVLALCDKDILGMRLSDGEMEIHVSEMFYGGKDIESGDIPSMVKKASYVNIMGDMAVDALIDAKMVSEDDVLRVCGVKHAQIYSLF